jgi:predicted ATPase
MNNEPNLCERKCSCHEKMHDTRLIVVTGGPGAGKTAILEMAKKVLCEHIAILPEAASVVFGGGFWRLPSTSAKKASQRAIYHVQKELEFLTLNEKKWAVGLCDRGTLDGFAYWPDSASEFWQEMQTTEEKELRRYSAVVHLRTPSEKLGYNHQNPLRTESAQQALEIDKKITNAWSKHPHYHVIESSDNFLAKAQQAMDIIATYLPECCRQSLSGLHE